MSCLMAVNIKNMYCKSILLLVLTHQLIYAQGFDDKLQKGSKSSDSKLKLAKTESLRSEEAPHQDDGLSVLGITVPPEYANSSVMVDHHIYYNSTFYLAPEVAKQFWVDLDKAPQKANIHAMLSNSHRQATTVELSFEFPFYGHLLKNITIATGGFLYMGDYLHNWIAATQYVAPLMANFDTKQSPNSLIKYLDNGTAFTTQWENVYIQNKMEDGAFTFQVTLHKNGDIVFAYKDVPYPVTNISDAHHPVKIGISDAYILERSIFFVRRKTIYEYHRIDMLKKNVSNNTALYFVALPTCPGYKDCSSCLAAAPSMECGWCNAVQRCSNGVDRAKQNWVANDCVANKATSCPSHAIPISTDYSPTFPNREVDTTTSSRVVETTTKIDTKSGTSKYRPSSKYNVDFPDAESSDNTMEGHAPLIYVETTTDGGMSAGAVITIVAFIAALIGAIGWIGYAYKFPQTPSGQFLIKYRPSQWTLRSKDDSSVTSSSRHI